MNRECNNFCNNNCFVKDITITSSVKLLHFLIIIVPITSSIIVGIYITVVPVTMPVRPLTMTIIETTPFTLHEGDVFHLDVSVYNPNSFSIPIPNIVTSDTFNPSYASFYHPSSCSAISENLSFEPLDYTEISIPYSSCDGVNIANSAGETNATASIKYYVNGKQYTVNASKTFTILPDSHRGMTLTEQ